MNMSSPVSNIRGLAIGVLACGIVNFPAAARSMEQVSGVSEKPRTIVAAGFGFQDADSSSITVKTYDAQSGEVLTEDTYELDIKDDGPPSSHPRTRIFAGGVGVGKDGLSEFILRVYDAANGRFLWEGRLNLNVGNNPEVAAYRVLAQVQPRVAVTRIAHQTTAAGQPYFVLRAVNPETGQLVWAHEFSAEGAQARVERVNRSIVGMTGTAPRDIDFRIKMPDNAGRGLLWEDKIVPGVESEATVPERSDDTAGMSPGGYQRSVERMKKHAI